MGVSLASVLKRDCCSTCMTLGVGTEGSMPNERGARLSTFELKNRRSNEPRNGAFEIIKEAIDVTSARGFLAAVGGTWIRQIYRRGLMKLFPELFPIERRGTPQVESPAIATITYTPFLIRRPRAPRGGMAGYRFVRTACRVMRFIRIISRFKNGSLRRSKRRKREIKEEKNFLPEKKMPSAFEGHRTHRAGAGIHAHIPSRHQSLI